MFKMYVEDGNTIKTAWDGSIALSHIPVRGRALPYALTIEKYSEAGGDYAGTTINVTAVAFLKKYFVVRNLAGTIQTTHYFNDFTMHKAGQYKLSYEKDGSGNITVRLYEGRYGTKLVYDSSNSLNEQGVKITHNSSIPNSTVFDGYLEYEYNVTCVGSEVTLALGAAEKARAFATATTPLYTLEGNFVRFYVKEAGAYKMLDDTSAATKEIAKVNMLVDTLLKTSYITQFYKNELDMSIDICFETSPSIKIRAGEVENKSTWTKTVAGLNLMLNQLEAMI